MRSEPHKSSTPLEISGSRQHIPKKSVQPVALNMNPSILQQVSQEVQSGPGRSIQNRGRSHSFFSDSPRPPRPPPRLRKTLLPEHSIRSPTSQISASPIRWRPISGILSPPIPLAGAMGPETEAEIEGSRTSADKGTSATRDDTVEVHESSEVVVDEDRSVNQSFLFKLLISHKKVEGNASTSTKRYAEENLHSTVPGGTSEEGARSYSQNPVTTEAPASGYTENGNYHDHNYFSVEAFGYGNDTDRCQDEQNIGTIPPGGGEKREAVIGAGDSESVSSREGASGNLSGYEDILAELSPIEKKRFYVAHEILTSERTFVEVLNLLTMEFPRYVRSMSKYHGTQILSKGDLDIILGGLPNLKRVNEDLLIDLEDRIGRWRENPKIADILVKKGPFLKLYATYIKDLEKISKHLDTCCLTCPLFATTVKEFEHYEKCHKLGLKHYMLKPVQRMPQYRLLLEDYLKSLQEENEDYQDTLRGIAIVKDVAEHANEAIRLQENAGKLLHLQTRLSGAAVILKSYRQLIREGELLKVCRKQLQPRFFVLTNDCLLCCTYIAGAGAPKDLKLRYELPLAGMRISLSPAEDYQHEFTVISVTRSFNLVAKTLRELDEWMEALENAIQDNIKKRISSNQNQDVGFQLGRVAPVWIHDSRVSMCQQCTAEFTITFRRHHCRACGKVVCGNCSGNEAPLQFLQNSSRKKRVCDLCYEYLLEEFDSLSYLGTSQDKSRASIRDKFRKVTLNVSKRANKIKRSVPSRLEIHANSSGSRISGYLHWREIKRKGSTLSLARERPEKKSWKRRWFVLIDRVLYIYAASEDIVAIKSIPLLGWQVEFDKSEQPQESEESRAVFRLTHMGHPPIHFQADNLAIAEKWVAAMNEVVVL